MLRLCIDKASGVRGTKVFSMEGFYLEDVLKMPLMNFMGIGTSYNPILVATLPNKTS
jgi:hypothetical protein